MTPILVLVGPPGAGKSTVAALVAERLGVDVLDTDRVVERQTELSVADVFVQLGEARFRELEADAVRASLEDFGGVLALGGGAVLDASMRALLAEHPVVWLRVGLAEQARRVGLGTSRPLLLGNVRATLKNLADQREPLYREVARLTVDTDGHSPAEVADVVVTAIDPTTQTGGTA